MAPDNITLEELKANVSYNSQSGEFTRLKNTTRESVGAITGSDFVNQDGMNYTQVSVCGGRYYAHRLAWFYVYGIWPIEQIDHIDHNGKNNSLCNLREVSNSQNQKNRRIGKNNRSGVIGVSFYKKTSTWQAYVNVNKRLIHLGFFPLFEDAVAARKIAEREHDFHPNHGT
jgi:hypothetical protein